MKALGYLFMFIGGVIDIVQLFIISDGITSAESFNNLTIIGSILFLIGILLASFSDGSGKL